MEECYIHNMKIPVRRNITSKEALKVYIALEHFCATKLSLNKWHQRGPILFPFWSHPSLMHGSKSITREIMVLSLTSTDFLSSQGSPFWTCMKNHLENLLKHRNSGLLGLRWASDSAFLTSSQVIWSYYSGDRILNSTAQWQ